MLSPEAPARRIGRRRRRDAECSRPGAARTSRPAIDGWHGRRRDRPVTGTASEPDGRPRRRRLLAGQLQKRVDLSDPEDPEEVGALELPGFSSYLHPVDEDHVLGVGEERGKVKTVLFDVSNRSDPTIADAKVLDRGYSAVSESHHAFLMDRKHGVFVLPAGTESLVMDYTDGSLAVEATVETENPATRTRYVEDSLYVFAGDAVTVVDETDWEVTEMLGLDG